MAESEKGPWVKPGEPWIKFDRLVDARAHGYKPVELVWFSETGWRREAFHTPGCLRDQGVDISWAMAGEIGPRPFWKSPPDIPFRSKPSPFTGPEFEQFGRIDG
jgi:hypothetical protein